jgi:biotin carboxylase
VAVRELSVPGERTLLVVSGGTEAIAGIARARELGLHVLVSDGDPHAPGLAAADEYLLASTYDVEATVAAAKRYHREVRRIDGVICIASDVPVTVASVAAELALPGVPLETARLSADKLALKLRLAEHNVASPAFAPLASAADLYAHTAEHGYPLVVKPVDSRGARGVLLLWDDTFDLSWAYETARRESPTGRVIVERFLDGPQISTESLVVDGLVHTVGLVDRNYEHLGRFAPHVIENGGELPSRLDADTQLAVHELLQRAAAALGVDRGVLKGDVVLSNSRPHLIEIAVRLSGGYMCTHELPLSTGVDFVGQAIRIALGETPAAEDLRPTRNVGVAQRWMFPTPGRVTRIGNADAVSTRPEIALCEVRVREGDLVPPISSHRSRGGVVIATGATRQQAIGHACRAVAEIQIETAPT